MLFSDLVAGISRKDILLWSLVLWIPPEAARIILRALSVASKEFEYTVNGTPLVSDVLPSTSDVRLPRQKKKAIYKKVFGATAIYSKILKMSIQCRMATTRRGLAEMRDAMAHRLVRTPVLTAKII